MVNAMKNKEYEIIREEIKKHPKVINWWCLLVPVCRITLDFQHGMGW